MIAIVKVFLSKKIRDTILLKKSEEYYAHSVFPEQLVPIRLGGKNGIIRTKEFLIRNLQKRQDSELTIQL